MEATAIINNKNKALNFIPNKRFVKAVFILFLLFFGSTLIFSFINSQKFQNNCVSYPNSNTEAVTFSNCYFSSQMAGLEYTSKFVYNHESVYDIKTNVACDIEIGLEESRILSVSSNSKYITALNIILFIATVLLALVLLCALVIPPKTYKKLWSSITNFAKKHKTLAEILRFVIVGGIATIIDMFTMGVVMYFMQKSIYPSFINVFINAPTPSTAATITGTTVGFVVGLVVNYVLSILFVFNEKGNSKTFKGFVVFCLLSAIGLVINIIGTYIGFDLLHINQWLVKIIMIVIVLIYNYISKKLVLFKNPSKGANNLGKNLDTNSENSKKTNNDGNDHK